MKLPLKEPLSARYLNVSPENIVHVFMPIVSGTNIGLDNTCKAVYALQEFFNKGSNSNKKISLKVELLAYKEALENDISLLDAQSELTQQKQERLIQINAYLNALAFLEKHPELNCLNSGFPNYPKPLGQFMQDRARSNLYSMVLRPTDEDGFLRSEVANPLFSVAHKSVSRDIQEAQSKLQQALIEAYTPLNFQVRDLKSQVIQRVLNQLQPPHVPVDFERLRELLHDTVEDLVNVSVDFTKDEQGNPIQKQEMDNNLEFDAQTSPVEYMEALFGYCAGQLFETATESPFSYLAQAEQWSIATQFLLGITNVYCFTHDLIDSDTNFGQILDKSSNLSTSLAQTLVNAQKTNTPIEETCLMWINQHFKRFKLKAPLTAEDIQTIKQDFTSRYLQIKDSPHFDEFFVLNTEKKGHFFTHQGSICMSFPEFASSPLLDVPPELTQPLEPARAQASDLDVNIPHNCLVQEDITIDTAVMDNAELQTLYERINTYQDPKLKKDLLTQLKQERPDFKPKIDAKQFLQQVAYGQQNEAESLLQKDSATTQELLTTRKVPFTDYSGRTFNCTAYEYAYWAKDTHMCRMLERYMDDETKFIILKRVEKIEELIGDLFKHPRGLAYTQKGKEYRSAHFDLTPLKKALKNYIEAYDQSPKNTAENWEELDTLWIKVGLPQREVPAHIAQEYCHPKRSFEKVVKDPTLLDADRPANLRRRLKFFNFETGSNDAWFTPTAAGEESGLGFSFAIVRAGFAESAGDGMEAAGPHSGQAAIDLAAIEAIDEARTKDLMQSREHLAAPSNLQAPGHHGI
ncbi:SidC [Legionella bononiensis]|uniref:SidC n=1 Tax=Legionella bononiensis TaxID=2793102 RepID=A0ABS1WDZ1_9GAMM|nr:SidC [Legionella bononiensis]MBL7479555.1 SidC [Legionella bononiensis]MBL7527571.1 SidC [Legionella bononiensis]